jgi:hypothetical protein
MSREVMDTVAFWANIATLVLLVLTVVALRIGAKQLYDGRRAASGGALIALNESFRQAWLQFSNAKDEGKKQYTFSDVMNVLNMACAIFDDKLFVGQGGRLLEDYLCHVFSLIGESDDAKGRIERMITTDKTFEHILRFVRNHRPQIKGFKLPPAVNEPSPPSD